MQLTKPAPIIAIARMSRLYRGMANAKAFLDSIRDLPSYVER
jgi:hypothetical protein